MVKITVDGICYEVDPANNLLQECLSQGLDLPYFCWHPSMGSVGACRQCAVIQYRDAEDKKGTLVMSCMTPVTEGGIYSLASEQASWGWLVIKFSSRRNRKLDDKPSP